VATEVREKIDQLKAIVSPKGARLWDVMTNPNTPMSMRLKLQDKYIVPMMEELKKKDLEEEKRKGSKKKSKKKTKIKMRVKKETMKEKNRSPHPVSADYRPHQVSPPNPNLM